MRYDVRIGKYRLRHVESIHVESSVEKMVDTATISLPATVFNKSMNVSNLIKVGDAVAIGFGYGDTITQEFKGYLSAIKTEGGNLVIECEDELYTFRTDMPDKQYAGITLKTLMEELIKCVNKYRKEKGLEVLTVETDYAFSYDKFTINTATAYEVLSKIHDETKANIFVFDSVLHIQPPYKTMDQETVDYSMQKNIDRDGLDLKWKRLDEKKIKIVNKGKNAKGKTISVVVGEAGGDTITMHQSGVTTEENLKRIAESVYNSKRFEGYEGSFTTWLVPFVTPGCVANLTDTDDPEKNGKYYILSVVTDFNSGGGKRKIGLGKKL